jgi:hypothetical protein
MSTNDLFSHCSIWLCYTASDLALAHKKTKFESSTCTIYCISDNENINLKMSSFLWQGNLPNRASKTSSLARHDRHLHLVSVKLQLKCPKSRLHNFQTFQSWRHSSGSWNSEFLSIWSFLNDINIFINFSVYPRAWTLIEGLTLHLTIQIIK